MRKVDVVGVDSGKSEGTELRKGLGGTKEKEVVLRSGGNG